MKSAIRQSMIGLSSLINHTVAANLPGVCPFILVCEFPRSGANWIRDMIGDALQLPVPRLSLCPITFSSLVHSHFVRVVKRAPVVYVVRDGRDVFISHYYKVLNTVRKGSPAHRRRAIKLHPSLRSSRPDRSPEDGLRVFYDEWKNRPLGSRVNWGAHVKTWLKDKSPNVQMVRYEDMLENPQETLRAIIRRLTADEIDDDVIEFAVRRNSFEYKTGRKSGIIKNDENRRSGRAGGWRDTLPDDLKDRFLSDFGDELKLLGYFE